MKVQQKSSEYYVSKLCVESVLAGKVRKKALMKCLKAVSNSVNNKMRYGECNERIGYLKEMLSYRGSNMMDKKLELIDSIFSYSVKTNHNTDALQNCMIEMRFKRDFLWRKDFGINGNKASHHLNDDLAKKLKFNLLKRDHLAMEKKIISGIEMSKSCLINNRRCCAGCMKPGSTRLDVNTESDTSGRKYK